MGWRYQHAFSESPAGLRKGALKSQCAFCFGYREAGLRAAPASLPGVRNIGAVGPGRSAEAGSCGFWNAPGDHLRPAGQAPGFLPRAKP